VPEQFQARFAVGVLLDIEHHGALFTPAQPLRLDPQPRVVAAATEGLNGDELHRDFLKERGWTQGRGGEHVLQEQPQTPNA